MTQKINPISLRLGITQVWDSILQNYGKLNKNYSLILHKQIQFYKFLMQLLNSSKLLVSQKELQFKNNYVLVNLYYLNENLPISSLDLTKISKIIFQWFFVRVVLRLYLKYKLYSSINLVFNYTKYLLEQGELPTKILWNLCRFLEVHLNANKVFNSVKGPIRVNLKGFKIRLAGRLDGSKNQMAKTIEQKVGSLPLASLKSYVEFLNTEIHTKLGTCGLQIWLFYSIIN
uniref:Ribosomal protein S3 n=1 Tax=Sebdenia flabellata TaxID=42024 RepID=A0A0E3DBT9_9FLOR|nr:ribosomal protein S3 [Sebdenia flabellata]